MKLVFVTQVLDRRDAVLGFVHRWVRGLADAAEAVRVVALEVGDTTGLPGNVSFTQIGRRGAIGRFLRYRRALKSAFGSDGFDGLLTHMVPRYSTLAAAYARGVPHFLWYTHKGVDRRLLRALEVVDGAFTASEESLRVDSPKKIVTGHGIDADHFDVGTSSAGEGSIRLLSVGRLTPAKDPMTVVEAVDDLRRDGRDVTLTWAGAALAPGDDEYGDMLKRAIDGRDLAGAVNFVGEVGYPDVPALYRDCDVFVNASRTGSVDKVVLEAMAARRSFVSCNESIPPLLRAALGAGASRDAYRFEPGDSRALARSIESWADMVPDRRAACVERLAQYVREHHDVDRLMQRLVAHMSEVGA